MASQSGEHNDLDFTGESAEEAQDFVRAVNKHAFAAGRQKDTTWIAELAYSCFSRKALLWYETLDEETQNDWKLLKRAILTEFAARPPAPATVPSAAPASISSLSTATPAAPPPSAVTVKIGRIRVDFEDRTQSGYLDIGPKKGVFIFDPSKANLFETDSLSRTVRFQGREERLAIRGAGSNRPLNSAGTHEYGLMMKSSEGSGTQWNHTWSIGEDGNITAMLQSTDRGQYEACFLVYSGKNDDRIHIPADKEALLRHYSHLSWRQVTLHLEPVS